MSNVFLRFRQSVLARNTALAEFHPKCVMVQGRQPRGLAKRKPAGLLFSRILRLLAAIILGVAN
jgi:hypothetical protein